MRALKFKFGVPRNQIEIIEMKDKSEIEILSTYRGSNPTNAALHIVQKVK